MNSLCSINLRHQQYSAHGMSGGAARHLTRKGTVPCHVYTTQIKTKVDVNICLLQTYPPADKEIFYNQINCKFWFIANKTQCAIKYFNFCSFFPYLKQNKIVNFFIDFQWLTSRNRNYEFLIQIIVLEKILWCLKNVISVIFQWLISNNEV